MVKCQGGEEAQHTNSHTIILRLTERKDGEVCVARKGLPVPVPGSKTFIRPTVFWCGEWNGHLSQSQRLPNPEFSIFLHEECVLIASPFLRRCWGVGWGGVGACSNLKEPERTSVGASCETALHCTRYDELCNHTQLLTIIGTSNRVRVRVTEVQNGQCVLQRPISVKLHKQLGFVERGVGGGCSVQRLASGSPPALTQCDPGHCGRTRCRLPCSCRPQRKASHEGSRLP